MSTGGRTCGAGEHSSGGSSEIIEDRLSPIVKISPSASELAGVDKVLRDSMTIWRIQDGFGLTFKQSEERYTRAARVVVVNVGGGENTLVMTPAVGLGCTRNACGLQHV